MCEPGFRHRFQLHRAGVLCVGIMLSPRVPYVQSDARMETFQRAPPGWVDCRLRRLKLLSCVEKKEKAVVWVSGLKGKRSEQVHALLKSRSVVRK